MRRVRLGRAATFAAVALILSAQGAWADGPIADGDGLTPIASSGVAFGNVCLGTTTSKPVLVAINRQGGGAQVYANSSSVAVSVDSISPAALTATGGGTIVLPSAWVGSSNGTQSTGTVTLSVSVTASALGLITGDLTIKGAGTSNATFGPLNRFDEIAVTAMVVGCDTTPPTLNLPSPITAEATGPFGAAVNYVASASDATPASPTVTCSPASGSTFPIAATTVGCSATDAAGNTANGSFTVTVQDTTAPTIVGTPAGELAEAAGPDGAVVTYANPTATDIVDGARPVSCAPASGSTFALGATAVDCTASDSRGNAASTSFDVIVSDTTDPVLIVPGDITAEATSSTGAAVLFAATASDLVDGSIAPICDAASGDTFPLGTTIVTCTATDSAGNDTSGSFSVTVEDTTAPDVTVPASFSAEATGASGAEVAFGSSAIDLVDGPLTPACSPGSGATFPLGPTTVTCTATDTAGNTGSASFIVTVVDTTPPTLTLPADQVIEATAPGGAVATFVASADDLVDGAVAVLCSNTSGDTFPLGTTIVGCSATDVAGNTATGSFSIEVVDTTPPALTVPDSVTAEATGPGGAVVAYTATAHDLVDGAVTPVCTPASGAAFALGATSVECSATDNVGNSTTTSFTVTVVDTTPPAIIVPSDIAIDPTSIVGAVVTYAGQSATDIVDGSVAVTCAPPSGASFGFGVTTVTCSATDDAGNTGSNSFTVTVNGFMFAGFHQPVDMNAVNTVKNGSTIPVKWELFGAGGIEFTDTGAVAAGWPKAQKVNCASLGMTIEDAIETTATGGTSLRYDGTSGQFIYNWQTPKQAGTCWRLDVKLVDGSTKSATFKLK